jgi:hypothetical protein
MTSIAMITTTKPLQIFSPQELPKQWVRFCIRIFIAFHVFDVFHHLPDKRDDKCKPGIKKGEAPAAQRGRIVIYNFCPAEEE